MAVHRGHHRLVQLEAPQQAVTEGPPVSEQPLVPLVVGRAGPGDEGDESAQIGAGAEGALAGAGEDRDPDVGVVADVPPGFGQSDEHLRAEGVVLVGSVEREPRHVAPLLVEQVRFHQSV
jgi:hypothetical protein